MKGSSMRHLYAALSVCLLACVLTVCNAPAGTLKQDPRVCATKFGIKLPARSCVNTAAVNAIKARFALLASHPDPLPACSHADAPYLRVLCDIPDDQGHFWRAVVTFKATPAGWRSAIALTKLH